MTSIVALLLITAFVSHFVVILAQAGALLLPGGEAVWLYVACWFFFALALVRGNYVEHTGVPVNKIAAALVFNTFAAVFCLLSILFLFTKEGFSWGDVSLLILASWSGFSFLKFSARAGNPLIREGAVKRFALVASWGAGLLFALFEFFL